MSRRLLSSNPVEETKVKSFDQATKGLWWMPWHREAMKDVATCDKPRVSGSKSIRGSPNGETPPVNAGEP